MTNMPDEQRKTVIEKYGSEEEFHKHFEEQMSRKGWIRLFPINDQEKASCVVRKRLAPCCRLVSMMLKQLHRSSILWLHLKVTACLSFLLNFRSPRSALLLVYSISG